MEINYLMQRDNKKSTLNDSIFFFILQTCKNITLTTFHSIIALCLKNHGIIMQQLENEHDNLYSFAVVHAKQTKTSYITHERCLTCEKWLLN